MVCTPPWHLTQKWQPRQGPAIVSTPSNTQVGGYVNYPVSIFCFTVGNLIAKLNEPDFFDYIKSFYFVPSGHSLVRGLTITLPRKGLEPDGVAVLVHNSKHELDFNVLLTAPGHLRTRFIKDLWSLLGAIII